jgi:hypothetical protein
MQPDALEMFRAMRPEAPTASDGVRPAGKLPQGAPDLHSLAMVPGTPGYNSRIPLPPCAQCGEDHVPTHNYGHPWMAQQFHDEPVSAGSVSRRPVVPLNPVAVSEVPERRVTLYVGRHDTYVIAVEEAPEWDTLESFKVADSEVLYMIRMARALGAKVTDKTGGDLLMLEQEYGQSTQNHGGGAASVGDPGPRRQAQPADRTEVDQPAESDGAPRGLPEPVGAGEGTA